MLKGAQSPYFEKIDVVYKRLTVTINVKTPNINTTIIKEQGWLRMEKINMDCKQRT